MRTRLIISAVALLAGLPVFAQDEVDAFMTKFEEAVKADNYASMKELVTKAGPKTVKNAYWRWEYQLASAISNKSEEDKAQRQNVMEKLTSLISQEFKDRLPSDRLAWTKALTPELAAKRVQMGDTMTEAEQLLGRAEKANDKAMFQQAAAKYVAAAALAAETKDLYWDLSDFCWLAFIADKLEEKYDTAYWYKKALESARERKLMDYVAEYQIPEKLKRLSRGGLRDDLIDYAVPLEESKKKYAATMEKLAAEAVNPGAPGTDSKPAGVPGSPAAAGGPKTAMPGTLPPAANKHTMRIEWVDVEKVVYKEANGRPVLTPNIRANGHWVHWIQTEMGPSAALENPAIVPGDHTFKFEKGKLIFDPDGKGKAGEERLKVQRGKPEVLVFKQRILPDGSKVDARFLAMEPPNAFTVNGVGLTFENPGPNDPLRLRWQGATAATSKFDGWDVTIFDDSADGKFDAYGDDSIMISKGKTGRVVPLSRYVYVGDLLFEVKMDASGQNLRFKPYDGPIALIQFEFVANTMPAFMILEGLNENAQFFINLMDCKDKPMWVPPGEYKFRGGYFAYGEGDKRETISVGNAKSTQFKVAEGTLNKVQMGGAKAPGFACTWKTDQAKDKGKTIINLRGKNIQIFGCANEEYMYFFAGAFKPVVKMRAGKDGPVFYEKQMKAPGKEDVADNQPWDTVLLFPRSIDVEKTVSGDVYVQLEGEHPKLGKITSTPTQVE